MSAARLHVFGLGSPFGDDAVGLLVIEALSARPQFAGRVRFHALDRPGTRLIPLLQAATEAILIDAVSTGAPPGTLHFLSPHHLRHAEQGPASSHGLGLAQTLSLAAAMGALPAQLEIWGIEMGQPPTPDQVGLSPALSREFRAMTDRIEALLLARLRQDR